MISAEPPGELLDLGSGRGEFTASILKDGWRVVGVDLEPAQLSQATRRGVVAVGADVSERLPFRDCSFNCVFAGEIIEHLLDTDLFISEIYRVLAPNGCMVVTTPNLASAENRLRILFGIYPIWVNYRLEGVGHVRAYTPRTLKRQLLAHGLAVEEHCGNWVPFIPQRFLDDLKLPALAVTGDLFPSLAMDIIVKARKQEQIRP
jgi:ubiquinone/menaquinone biosynthesis C-methylase UbiE